MLYEVPPPEDGLGGRIGPRVPESPMFVALRLLALSAILLATGRLVEARELYVNNRVGNDQQNGLSASPAGGDGPVASIGRALKLARWGDHIQIANTGQAYHEQVSIFGCQLYGSEERPLTISGNGATLDGTVQAAAGAWRHVEADVFAMQPRRMAYQQLFLDGKPLTKIALLSHHGSADALQPLQWAYLPGKVLLRVKAGDLPEYYNLRHAGLQTGITLYNTRNVVIEDLIVQGFQQDGVNAHELVRNCVLRGVQCRANGRAGLSVGGVSQVRVEQSGFYDNGRVQLRAEGNSRLALVGCEVAATSGTLRFGLNGGQITQDSRPVDQVQ